MGGLELASHLEVTTPGKIALVATHQPPRAFLLKPFTPDELAMKVRDTCPQSPRLNQSCGLLISGGLRLHLPVRGTWHSARGLGS
jgi:hypothetical protein